MPVRKDLFLLDPDTVHLNHGSFGAVPIPVLEARRQVSERIERSPERFYRHDLFPALTDVRLQAAAFLNTDPDGLVLTANVTESVQVVLNSLDLQSGDQIVFTDHTYVWVKAAINRACRKHGATAREVSLPVPPEPASLLAVLTEAVTERTALIVLDHITSASALTLPVQAVCDRFGQAVPILIDGAHAPGLIPEPVPAGAAFWTGNFHKWGFGARTVAALTVAEPYRHKVRPLVASAGSVESFPLSFSYQGTRDVSAFLTLPASLQFPAEHLGLSFMELKERNLSVLRDGLRLAGLPERPDTDLPLATIPLGPSDSELEARSLTEALRRAGVEVAITWFAGQLWARVSVQAYVGHSDFTRLAAALDSVRDQFTSLRLT